MGFKTKALPALRGDAVTPGCLRKKKSKGTTPQGALDSPLPCCTPGALVRCSLSLEDPAAGPQEGSRMGCGVTRSPLPSLAALC